MIGNMTTVNAASNTLLQYGAIGVVLAVLLGLFTWSFRLILMRFLKAFDGVAEKLGMLDKGMAVHATETAGQHRQVMSAMFAHNQSVTEKLDAIHARGRRPTG